MFVIASNITTRSPKLARAFKQAKSDAWNTHGPSAQVIMEMAREVAKCGADAIEIDMQQHADDPEALKFAVESVQGATDIQLCLSSNKPEVLQAGLSVCNRPPIINYLAIEELRLRQVLPAAVASGASLVLLVSDPSAPADAREMLEKVAILVGAANSEGIPNDRLFVDPGVIHVTSELGQRHASEVLEFLRELPHVVDPAVRSTCWLTSSSSGAPAAKRSVIETAMLFAFAGAGLSSVFLDVLRRENLRAVRLAKIFRNELVYSDGDIEL
jgi:cobalamin-dependent methionine synthase I